jgi:hypothetical protein
VGKARSKTATRSLHRPAYVNNSTVLDDDDDNNNNR